MKEVVLDGDFAGAAGQFPRQVGRSAKSDKAKVQGHVAVGAVAQLFTPKSRDHCKSVDFSQWRPPGFTAGLTAGTIDRK